MEEGRKPGETPEDEAAAAALPGEEEAGSAAAEDDWRLEDDEEEDDDWGLDDDDDDDWGLDEDEDDDDWGLDDDDDDDEDDDPFDDDDDDDARPEPDDAAIAAYRAAMDRTRKPEHPSGADHVTQYKGFEILHFADGFRVGDSRHRSRLEAVRHVDQLIRQGITPDRVSAAAEAGAGAPADPAPGGTPAQAAPPAAEEPPVTLHRGQEIVRRYHVGERSFGSRAEAAAYIDRLAEGGAPEPAPEAGDTGPPETITLHQGIEIAERDGVFRVFDQEFGSRMQALRYINANRDELMKLKEGKG
jgi:hypothetical protein